MANTWKAALMILAMGVAALGAEPSFSGQWKMDRAKSTFEGTGGPLELTLAVKHEGASLALDAKQVTEDGRLDFTFKVTTDGKECTNEIGGGVVKSKAEWDGAALKLVSRMGEGGDSIVFDDRWTVDESAKTMTIKRKMTGPFGEAVQTMVFAKQ